MSCSVATLRFFGLAGLLVLGAGCQSSPPSQPLSGPKDTAVLATEALETGDYGTALELYQAALVKKPESLPLHYGLALAAAHLGARDDATRAFAWVVANGAPGSPEVEAARHWLVNVGATPAPADGFTADRKSRRPRDG